MGKIKEPVKLRKRTMATGNVSLYLDIYVGGKRSYEYLHLYLVPEKTRADKEKNRETWRMADAVRAKRVVEVQNERFGFEQRCANVNFLDYFHALCEAKREESNTGTYVVWDVVYGLLKQYTVQDTTFKDVTREWCMGFRSFLNETKLREYSEIHKKSSAELSDSTKNLYLAKLTACLNRAIEDGIILTNPMNGVHGYKDDGHEHERVYLTLEEVRTMAATPFKHEGLKRAFLFSCLTGFRKSDILKMTWGEVRKEGNFTRIVFRQKKTGGQEYMDINPQAVEFMGKVGKPTEKVFGDFRYCTYTTVWLQQWAKAAGVDKEITFHSGRHTFAVLMLNLGADIYTVSKLLGHREIKTTQIYAKVMDKKKQEAAMLIPQILPQKVD
jgi:integrase